MSDAYYNQLSVLSLQVENDKLRAENARLRAALSWVREIHPGKNAGSGGAIIHMTWNEWNALRVTLGLREQVVPEKASQTVRLIKARRALEDKK